MNRTTPVRTKIIRAILIALIVLLAIYFYAGSSVPAGQQPLVRLDTANIGALRNEFNASADSVRILVLLSPT